MEKLFIVRHGATIWNEQRRYISWTDLNLSLLGNKQAKKIAKRLFGLPVEVIFTSPLKRCQETAEIIANQFKLEPIISDELAEVDFGQWEGLTYKEIKEQFGDLIDRWLDDAGSVTIPGGEDWPKFLQRVAAFLSSAGSRPEKVGVAVTHGGVIKAIVNQILNFKQSAYKRFLLSNASITAVGFANGEPYLIFLNDTSHLEEWSQSRRKN